MTQSARLLILSGLMTLCSLLIVSTAEAGEVVSIADVTVDHDMMDFGTVTIGSSRLDSFLVANTGDTSVRIENLAIEEDPSGQFRLRQPVVPATLAPQRFIRYHIEFRPIDSGCAEAHLVLFTNAGTDTVLLRGCAIPPPTLLWSETLSFGLVRVDTCRRMTFPILNRSGAITIRRILPDTLHPFINHTSIPDAGITIAGGDPVALEFSFCPDGFGAAGRSFRLIADNGWIDIRVEGKGAAPVLDVEPDTIDFGRSEPGVFVERSVRFTNRGELPLNVDGQMFRKQVFSLAPSEPASFTLGPGEGRDMFLRFLPDTTGHFDDIDTITSTSYGGDSYIVLHASAFVRRFWWDTVVADVGKSAVMLLHVDPPLQVSDGITGLTGSITFDPHSVRPHRFLPGPALASSGSIAWQRSDDSTMTASYMNGTIVGDTLLGFEFDGLSSGQPVSIVHGILALDTLKPSAIDTGRVYLNGCEVGLIRNFSRRVQVLSLERDPAGDEIVLRFSAPVGAAGAVRVVDLMGAERYRGDIGTVTQEEGAYRISMGELSTGAYLILLRIADDTSVVRIHWSR